MAQNKQIELPDEYKFKVALHMFYHCFDLSETYLMQMNDQLKKSGLLMHEEKRDMNKALNTVNKVLRRLNYIYMKEEENQIHFGEKTDFFQDLLDIAVHIEREKDRERIIEFIERMKIYKNNI